MAQYSQAQPKSQRSLMASPLYWLSIGPTLIIALLAFICSWPLGSGFVDEGGITKLRLGVALIAMALVMAVPTLVGLLLGTIRRVDEVSIRLSQLADEDRITSGTEPSNQSLNPTGNRPAS